MLQLKKKRLTVCIHCARFVLEQQFQLEQSQRRQSCRWTVSKQSCSCELCFKQTAAPKWKCLVQQRCECAVKCFSSTWFSFIHYHTDTSFKSSPRDMKINPLFNSWDLNWFIHHSFSAFIFQSGTLPLHCYSVISGNEYEKCTLL